MYEVTYSVDGVIMKSTIPANDHNQIFQIITNMYEKGKVQIINIIRKD